MSCRVGVQRACYEKDGNCEIKVFGTSDSLAIAPKTT